MGSDTIKWIKIKKVLNKILLGTLTFLLIIYLSFNLLMFYSLNISKKYIDKNKIYDVVDNVDITKLFKDVAGNELQQITNIKDELFDIGISEESINQLLNSDAVKELVNEAVTNSINDILREDNIEYRIDEERVEEILKNNVNEFKIDSSEYSEEKQKLIDKVKVKIVENANELIEKLGDKLQNSETLKQYKNYFYKTLSIIDIIYSPITYVILLTIIASFIILLLYIRRSFYKSLKWIGISFIIPGVILYFINLLIEKFINSSNKVNEFVKGMTTSIANDLKFYVNVSIIICVILVVVNIVIYIIKRKKNVGVLNEKSKEVKQKEKN